MFKDFIKTVNSYRYNSNIFAAIYAACRNRLFTKSYRLDSGFNKWAWHDKPEVLQEAMFRMIVDLVEKEHCFQNTDYSDAWKEAGDAIKAAYDFYKQRLPKLHRIEDKILEYCFGDAEFPLTLSPRQERRHKLHMKIETIRLDETTEHMVQIVKYHGFLWT